MKRVSLLHIWSVVAAVVLTGGMLQAQIANNTALVGNVVDQSGAPVAGAKVTAINEGTRVAFPG